MKWVVAIASAAVGLAILNGCRSEVPESVVITKPVAEHLCQPDEPHFPGCDCPPYCSISSSATLQFVVSYQGSPPTGEDGNPFILPLFTSHSDATGRREPKPQYNGHDRDSTLTFTVGIDTNGHVAPSTRIHLTIVAVDSAGAGSDGPFGHFHHSNTPPKPLGVLSDTIVTTDAITGRATITFTPSQYSGPIRLLISSPATDSTTRRHWTVGVPGLTTMTAPHVVLVGSIAPHPYSHAVIPSMIPTLDSLATLYNSTFSANLQINDMSLPYGGKFDLDTLWRTDATGAGSCLNHCEHRLGRSADINGIATSDTVRYNFIVMTWRSMGAGLREFPESGKAHLRDWRQP